MKGFLHNATVAKVFGYLGATALTLSQSGVKIGHVGNTDILSLLAMVAVAIGIHGASNSSNP